MIGRICLYINVADINGLTSLKSPAGVLPAVEDLKRPCGLFRAHRPFGKHGRFAVVVRMGMGYQIGIRLLGA